MDRLKKLADLHNIVQFIQSTLGNNYQLIFRGEKSNFIEGYAAGGDLIFLIVPCTVIFLICMVK